MINFIVNNASYLIGGGIVLFSVIGILVLSKESKKLSEKPASKSGKKDDKSAESSKTSEKTVETEKKTAKQHPKGAKVEKLIDTRQRYSRPIARTIEESESDERNQHISKVVKGVKEFEVKNNKKLAKSKPYTFISTQKKSDMPKYTLSPEEKDFHQRMTFINSKKGTVAKLASREKMLKVPTIKEPESEQLSTEEKTPELTAEEKRHLKFAKYFDKSRRISRNINDDNLDSLFDSHLSESYMDIDVDRHLDIGKKFNKKLYDMASKVLAHGEIKITDDSDLSVKANRKIWLKQKSKEENRRMRHENDSYEDFLDDELKREETMEDYIADNYNTDLDGENIDVNMNLSPKNILMVDSVLYRKRNRNRTSRLGRRK